jgi:hypothetical protein
MIGLLKWLLNKSNGSGLWALFRPTVGDTLQSLMRTVVVVVFYVTSDHSPQLTLSKDDKVA